MALISSFLDRFGRKEDVEYEQSMVRLIIGTIVIGYMFLSSSSAPWKLYLFVGFSVSSLFMVCHIHFYPGVFPVRRIIGQLIDLLSVSLYLYFGGQTAAAAFCVYLWVIVGNGCRFGIAYMASCTLIACVTFGYVILNVHFWQQHGYLAAGLWITQVVVPSYLIGLLNRLNAATSRLANLSRHDELTGLLNRRALNVQAKRELDRLYREPSAFGFILVDIDHFKTVNDEHGHLVGDIVLQQVANLLVDTCRNVDFVSRFGGEEFALLSPGSCNSDAETIGERLRQSIECADIHVNNKTVKVTISVGISCWNEDIKTLDDWIQKADQALYQAKERGRNRVVLSGS